MPVACAPGNDCAVAVYFDADPTEEARDYLCGTMTYNGHTGVDFALPDYATMDRGIAVLAAAPGRVVIARDGDPDARGEIDLSTIRERECGNGVLLEHEGQVFTQYCHMRQGSVTVLPGETVSAGTQLGLIGQSGQANFPHLHFQVQQDDQWIDPFSGRPADGCGNAGLAWWKPETAAALPYFAGLPYHAGFAPEEPSADGIRAGAYDQVRLTTRTPVITLWTAVWGVGAGDVVAMEIIGPDGATWIDTIVEISQAQSWWHHGIGRAMVEDASWLPGHYTGEITFTRAQDGHVWTKTVTVEVAEE